MCIGWVTRQDAVLSLACVPHRIFQLTPCPPHPTSPHTQAKELHSKDVSYIVKAGEIIIVDEFTGRTMPGRRWSDGLHQVCVCLWGTGCGGALDRPIVLGHVPSPA